MDSLQVPAPPSETLVSEPPLYPPSEPLSQSLYSSSSETLAQSSQTSPPPQTLVSDTNPIPPSLTLDQNDPNPINPAEPISPTPNSPSETQIKEIESSLVSENGVVDVNLTQSGTEKDNSGGEDETSSRRRRRSRWDPPAEAEAENGGNKKRKSRWAAEEPKPAFQLPDFMKDFTGGIDTDPEIQALNARLLEISRILQSGCQLDDRPEGARSPSPEPLYDNMGIRINTREYRARERLNRERQEIISQIIKRNPSYRPPADYRPPKINKKLYIPMKEYPGYNFIGLIIGPRGNTQKRMEKETGAKIVIRGKGSIKEGRLGMGTKRDFKYDPAENEDLHVLVEGDTQEAVDAAAGMVEKLLRPVDEGLNEHKRQQLRELAALNGTIREDEMCRLCGESGHRQFACPARMSTFKSEVLCKICGDGGHPTIDCPVKGTVGKKMDDEYQNFLAELGGSGPVSLTKQAPALAIMDSNSLGSNVAKIGKEIDDTNLYIGYLSPNFDDDALIRLFSPFGDIVMAKVIKDRVSGLSKGYGFVKYSDIAQANQAISSMNGYRLEGRAIAVRVAGRPPQPTVPPGPPPPPPPMSTYLAPNQAANVYPSQQITSGGPLGNPPAGNYMGAPVPWRSSVPPLYAPYPVTHGSNMYASIQGQPMPPYSVRYPPPGQPLNMPPSEAQQSYPPGVQVEINGSAQSTPYRIYGNSVTGVPPNSQATYPPSSLGYPSYYGVSHTMVDPQKFASGPWASNPPVPPPVSSAEQSQQTTYGADPEYEKFMAEMK